MAKPRGKEHTTLTETASLVVSELKKISGIKMIAPGEIKTTTKRKSGGRFVTAVFTASGMELIITGQSVQNVAVHVVNPAENKKIFTALQQRKKLSAFTFKSRDRKPGI